MNPKTSTKILALVFTLMLLPIVSSQADGQTHIGNVLYGDLLSLDKQPTSTKTNTGIFYIEVIDDKTSIYVATDAVPSQGKVLEAWLVDINSKAKSNLGALKIKTAGNGAYLHAIVDTNLGNDLLLITESSQTHPKSEPTKPVGVANLGKPFGN